MKGIFLITEITSDNELINKIVSKGKEIIYYIGWIAFFFFVVMCIMEVTKAVASKKVSDVPSIIIKYLIAYFCFNLITVLFTFIKNIFN